MMKVLCFVLLATTWSAPALAAPSAPRVITGPSGKVAGVAWSPDGSQLVTIGADRLLRIIDGETGLLRRVADGPRGTPRAVAWSPDGETIVVSDESGGLTSWKKDGTAGWSAALPARVVCPSLSFAPDGKSFVLACSDGGLRIVDARTGKTGRTLSAGKAAVRSVSWSRDGMFIASADTAVRFWNAQSGKMLRVGDVPPKKPVITVLAFAPDSRVIAGGTDKGQIDFWTVLDGRGIAEIDAHTERINTLSYSKSGEQLASGSDDKRLRVWNMNTGTVLTEFASHEGPVTSVQITTDGTRVASGSEDGSLKIWSVNSGELRQRIAGPRGRVVALSQFPGQRTAVTLTQEGDLAAWDLSTGTLRWQRRAHEGAGSALAVMPDGRYILSSGGFQRVGGQPGDGTAVVADGTRADVKVWDPAVGVPVRDLGAHNGLISALALSGDGRMMVSASDLGAKGDLLIWDVAAAATKARVGGEVPPIRALAFASGAPLFAAGARNGAVLLIDPKTTVTRQTLQVGSPVQAVALSSDGSLVATGAEKDGASLVQLWDAATGKLVRSLTGQQGAVSRLAFSADGWFLLSTSAGPQGDARLWIVQSGEVQSTAPGAAFGGYTAGDLAPDVHNIVLAGSDGVLRVWAAR